MFLHVDWNLAHLLLLQQGNYGETPKATVMYIEKSTNKWSHMCFKNIVKISHSKYLQFCSNLPVKFAIFLKSSLLINSFYCLFCS